MDLHNHMTSSLVCKLHVRCEKVGTTHDQNYLNERHIFREKYQSGDVGNIFESLKYKKKMIRELDNTLRKKNH